MDYSSSYLRGKRRSEQSTEARVRRSQSRHDATYGPEAETRFRPSRPRPHSGIYEEPAVEATYDRPPKKHDQQYVEEIIVEEEIHHARPERVSYGYDSARPGRRPFSGVHGAVSPSPPPSPPPRPDDYSPALPPVVRRSEAHGKSEDLALAAQTHVNGDHDDRIRDYLTICLYRNSKKAFQTQRVRIMKPRFRHLNISSSRIKQMTYVPDRDFMLAMRWKYKNNLRGPFRRILSFKTVSTARLLQYGDGIFATAEQNYALFSPTFMKAFENPFMYVGKNDTQWVYWLHKQKTSDKGLDIAIELIEDYSMFRVMSVAVFILVALLALSIVWIVEGGDASYMATVMSYALSFLTAAVGLTALWDFLDSGRVDAQSRNPVLSIAELSEVGRMRGVLGY
ncbi:hypothetical protein AAFC00_007315 [Neodothiora populina]|uniref:Uncharacterized protein n=1 Tax=Neodothiora populina TaxID=2781224 RepID=A0ABR3PHW6_9PEZI